MSTLRRILVAGVSGGVGVTTLSAMLYVRMVERDRESPGIQDHLGGSLAARLPGDPAPQNVGVTINDFGPHAATEPEVFGIVEHVGILLSRPTAQGVMDTGQAMRRIEAAVGAQHAQRLLVAVVATSPQPAGRAVTALRGEIPGVYVTSVPYDPALAAPGALIPQNVGRSAKSAIDALLTQAMQRSGA